MDGSECPPLKLLGGAVIDDPLTRARAFVESDNSYRYFDLAPVAQDNTLTEADIQVANRFGARMSPTVVAGILQRRGRISRALRRIPPAVSLMDDEASIPWDALRRLLDAFDGIRAIGLSRVTKALHRKRPALIPILDSVLERYLAATGVSGSGGLAERGVALTRAYKHEMDANDATLRCVRAALAAKSVDLTECRLLDIYMWMRPRPGEPIAIALPARPRGS